MSVTCSVDFIPDFIATKTSSSSSFDEAEVIAVQIRDATSENLFIQKLEVAAKSDGDLLLPDSEPRIFHAEAIEPEFNFAQREELFRRDYIDRLTMMKIIRPQSGKSHQTIAVFDWDDTLLPTSFLYYIGFEKVRNSPQLSFIIQKLDKHVAKILEKAIHVGKTYIITNAMQDWVETSSEMFLPLSHKIIKSGQITIISARSQHEESYPDDPKRWKLEAFMKLQSSLSLTTPTNLICMGDSEMEMEAAQHIGRRFQMAMIKTVKFKKQPRPEELVKQHELVIHKFEQIYTTLKTLSIKLEKKE